MKKIILTIITVLLCLGILGGGIAGIIKLTDGSMDTKKISSTKFTVGGLDTNGKYMNTNASIYTKDAFECQGLEVSLDFDNTVDYQIYFYDQNNDFVHTTGRLTGAFVKESVPFFAKYARIVVTPKEDDVVTALEVPKYAKQLTIKVNREQGFKNYTENLFVVGKQNTSLSQAGVESEKEGSVVSSFIDISNYKEACVVRFSLTNPIADTIYLCFYDAQRNFVSTLTGKDFNLFKTSQGYTYGYVDFSKISEDVSYMRTTCGAALTFEIYCR